VKALFLTTIAVILSWQAAVSARPAQPFTLAVVPTETDAQDRERSISISHEFDVVLSNVSAKPECIFEDWSSWGFFALSFKFVTDAGKKIKCGRCGPFIWTRNYPAVFTIPPGGHYVFHVRWGDKTWDDLHGVVGAGTLTAIFEEPASDPMAKMFDYSVKHTPVWIGRIESKPERILIEN
jgi:hypothetical protein